MAFIRKRLILSLFQTIKKPKLEGNDLDFSTDRKGSESSPLFCYQNRSNVSKKKKSPVVQGTRLLSIR